MMVMNMNNDEFQIVGLYNHNINSYKKIKAAFDSGENIVGIVHATGTGKSYNALQLSYDNKDKKIIYVVPSIGIIEYIKNIINNNPKLDFKRDFPNLEFRTYQSFISLSKEEIAEIDCDILILDEFHHIGAPIWGARINTMIETHPKAKIFGMTAYTIRDRGSIYEKDMINPNTNELFSRKIKSKYDLCDAMIDGIIPKPIYKSAYTNLIELEAQALEKVQKLDKTTNDYKIYMNILTNIKKRIHEAPNISDILRKNIKPNGKYIYFCPPYSEKGTNDIETIKKQAFEWFKQFVPEENIIFYTSTSEMKDEGKKNRDAFYNDVTLTGEKVSKKLRIMFAINQYNEGIHAPNVDGVIMGRGTTSDIVYFEQLGRALTVRGNTKEMFDKLTKYSITNLINMCKERDILVNETMPKEKIIEKLIAPIVIDLTNNYTFIKELENNLHDRIKNIKANKLGNKADIKIADYLFDIEIENQDLFQMLTQLKDRLENNWEKYYDLAKKYYNEYHNLTISKKFITNDGITFDENAKKLGQWIILQRKRFNKLSEERQKLLLDIGFTLNPIEENWQNNYNLAKKYYNEYHNLKIKEKFKTNDGITFDENGKKLGQWIMRQRQNFDKLSKERQNLLLNIGFIVDPLEENWQNNYNLAKAYYNHYGNLNIPIKFKTNDGITFDENGENIEEWIQYQRRIFFDLSEEKQKKLQEINLILNSHDNRWNKKYELCKAYYEANHNLKVSENFKTKDGITFDENGENIGHWIMKQRKIFDKLSKERQNLLLNIGFVLKPIEENWQNNYNLAKAYYNHYGNLNIPKSFKTNDGIAFDENGKQLGKWLQEKRNRFFNLSEERQKLLLDIGFILNLTEENWQNNYNLAKKYYNEYHNLKTNENFKTKDGITFDENGKKLGQWIILQRKNFNKLSEERQKLLLDIGFILNPIEENWQNNYNLAKAYYNHYGNLNIPKNFKTNDGITFDESGKKLGRWLLTQRQKCDQESKRGKLLTQIGMLWNVKKNNSQINKICIENNIDYKKNKNILSHISVQELQAKIEFLNSHNIALTNTDGLLIDIFYMSSYNMIEKYKISLEEMINEYYIENKKSRGV